MKLVLVVLFLVAVGIGLIGLERYSAGVGLESFMTRTRQITNAMPEDAVIKTMGGQPNERIDLVLSKRRATTRAGRRARPRSWSTSATTSDGSGILGLRLVGTSLSSAWMGTIG